LEKRRKETCRSCNIIFLDNDFEEFSPAITAPYPHKEPCSAQEDQPLLPEIEKTKWNYIRSYASSQTWFTN
jgi:hypothetical protein